MGRRYIVPIENLSLVAASDMAAITGASNKMCMVIRWWWRPVDNTLPSVQALQTRCRYLPPTVTAGTGGSSVTPQKVDPGDAAATFTAVTGTSTKATTSGTAATIDEAGAHVFNGYEQQPEKPTPVGPGAMFVFELTSAAIQGTVHINGGIEVEEIG